MNIFCFSIILAFTLECQALISLEIMSEFFSMKNSNGLFVKACNNNDSEQISKHFFGSNKTIGLFSRNVQWESIHNPIGIFMDISCPKNIEFLQKSEFISNLFNKSYIWLFQVESFDELTTQVTLLNLRFDSDVTLTWGGGETMYDIYKNSLRPQFITSLAYEWNSKLGLQNKLSERKLFLHGMTLRATISPQENIYNNKNISRQMLDRDYKRYSDVRNRLYYIIHLHIANLYNYSIDLMVAESGKETDLLASKRSDLAITPIRLINEGLDKADPLFAIQRFSTPFVFKQPRHILSYQALTLQLSPETWLCVGLIGILTTIVFYVTDWIVKRQNLEQTTEEEHEKTLSNCLLSVFGALSDQGAPNPPLHVPGRIICFFILLLGLMITTYYNAATIDALLSHAPVTIHTLRDVIDSLKIYFLNSYHFTHRETRNSIITKELADQIDDGIANIVDLEDGLAKLLRGYAVCGEESEIFKGIQNSFTDEQKCELYVLSSFPTIAEASFIAKNSPLREPLLKGIMRVYEHGLANREKMWWIPKKPICMANVPFVSVKIESVTVGLGVVAGGAILGFLFFLGEIAHFHFKKDLTGLKKLCFK